MQADWTQSSNGADWRVELERDVLLPGRLVTGRVTITARDDIDARGLIVALRATEHWKHRVTTTDAKGHTSTHVKTERRELVNEPVQVEGVVRMVRGASRTWPFELPVPPLGPATLEAEVAGLDWVFEAKLDVPGGFDSSIERPVRVVQPVALLRSGAVHLGQFALYDLAEVGADGVTGSIAVDPVPLCAGEPFSATAELRAGDSRRLQEIRAEIRVQVQATVPNGLEETIVAWASVVPTAEITGDRSIRLSGTLDGRALPSLELPHGRADATFHVILATAWAADPHLVRDIAIATTREL
jgi:hypothetical protein